MGRIKWNWAAKKGYYNGIGPGTRVTTGAGGTDKGSKGMMEEVDEGKGSLMK